MKTDTRQKQVLDQQLALSAYLDALLGEPATTNKVEAETGTGTETESGVQAAVVKPPPEVPVAETVAVPVVVEQAEEAESDWTETRFQALLFEVAGLTLAVPLVKLKGVVPNESGLTPMPGHSPLFLGVTPYQGQQCKVVDTARFVLPDDRTALLDADAGQRSAHLVVIDDGRWALACNRIGDVIELEKKDVKWRGANGKRLWLAGTVIEQMCALLDIDELTRELVEGMA